MRNQYKVLAEKYYIICEAEDTASNDSDPFEGFIYEYSVYSLINDIRHWPHAKEFIDWLFNKSDIYSADLKELAEDNDIVSAIEAACVYFDASAENFVAGYQARAEYSEDEEEAELDAMDNLEDNARDVVERIVKDAYSHFMEWWSKEQARRAALNKDNPGIEMDI